MKIKFLFLRAELEKCKTENNELKEKLSKLDNNNNIN